MDLVEDHLGLEALGVLLEALHQVRALHAVGVGRPVVDVGGGHELAALRDAGDQHRAQVGAGGVDRGGIAGGAGAENQQPGMSCRRHSQNANISLMASTVSTAVLKTVPLFTTFPEDQLRMLTTVVTRKSAPRSTTIMAGGDPTDSLYIVLSGRLR